MKKRWKEEKKEKIRCHAVTRDTNHEEGVDRAKQVLNATKANVEVRGRHFGARSLLLNAGCRIRSAHFHCWCTNYRCRCRCRHRPRLISGYVIYPLAPITKLVRKRTNEWTMNDYLYWTFAHYRKRLCPRGMSTRMISFKWKCRSGRK